MTPLEHIVRIQSYINIVNHIYFEGQLISYMNSSYGGKQKKGLTHQLQACHRNSATAVGLENQFLDIYQIEGQYQITADANKTSSTI